MKNASTTCFFCLVLSAMLVFEPVLQAQDDGIAAAQANAAVASGDSATAAALANAAAASATMGSMQSATPSVPTMPGPSGLSSSAPSTVPSAPIPVQIRTAKKIFIANAGDKTDLFPDIFSGGPERPYVQFYSAMEKWGHYQIVSTPEAANLIFEVGIASPSAAEIAPTSGSLGPWNGAELHDVQLRVKILDPKSRISLWEMDSHVQNSFGMNLKKTRDKEFNTAMSNLVLEVRQLSQQQVTTANSSALTQKGHGRGIKVATIVSLSLLTAGIIAILVFVATHAGPQPLPQPTYP